MLTDVFKTILNKPFKEIFNITFMRNIKNCKIFIFFPIKNF